MSNGGGIFHKVWYINQVQSSGPSVVSNTGNTSTFQTRSEVQGQPCGAAQLNRNL